ncbi:MAG: hypothetical protein WCA36_03940 [Pseudolabrys sp.]
MKGLLAAALLLIGLGSSAGAQQAFGPRDITNDVGGVPVTMRVTSWLTLQSAGDDIIAKVRIFADLIDLQRKFPDIVATLAAPANGCANRRGGRTDPVTALKRVSLIARDDQLVLSMRGRIDVWSCRPGHRKFALRWRRMSTAPLRIKLPVIRTWRHVAKRKEGSQRFFGNLPVYLVHGRDAAVSLQATAPTIELVGKKAIVNKTSLRLAKADIRRKAQAALARAINPVKLTGVLPAKLRKLKMTIVSAHFRAIGGHAIAEVNLIGQVPDGAGLPLLQAIAARTPQ